MTNKILTLAFPIFVMLTSCSKMSGDRATSSISSSTNGQGNGTNQGGVITAGEWNDLDNWGFWQTIINKDDFKSMSSHWSFFNNNRIVVKVVTSDSKPIIDAVVKLKKDGVTIFSARTDNKGKAELWAGLFQNNINVDFSKLLIDINNGSYVISTVKPFENGINNAVLPSNTTNDNRIEISFVVDATGSMGDELEYLKNEMLNVISRIKNANPGSIVSTSSIFYRDEGDEYVTRISNFTTDNNTTLNFIKTQNSDGGGDYPEAVHSALNKSVNDLQWSAKAKTRILFLVLDAPPHFNNSVLNNLQSSILKAAEKGIKIIPITASGIDKDTEFLMRFIAISTNGTYVFITNNSGIGDSHLEATVGEYQVEFLNNLMVRLINKYAE